LKIAEIAHSNQLFHHNEFVPYTLEGISEAYAKGGKIDKAIEFDKKALDAYANIFGREEVFSTHLKLSDLYRQQDNNELAVESIKAAEQALLNHEAGPLYWKKNQPNEHLLTKSERDHVINDESMSLYRSEMKLNRYFEAEQVLNRAEANLKNQDPKFNVELFMDRNNVANSFSHFAARSLTDKDKQDRSQRCLDILRDSQRILVERVSDATKKTVVDAGLDKKDAKEKNWMKGDIERSCQIALNEWHNDQVFADKRKQLEDIRESLASIHIKEAQ